jgi:phospho-N-acetylmuramoyl-pentapeptide-transferase
MFMGDTGSEALGATLGVVALMTGQWLLLPVIALIPMAETLSVILQVGYFKLTKGRRLFKMAPLHHHIELLGWSETQIDQRFWLVAICSAMVGIARASVNIRGAKHTGARCGSGRGGWGPDEEKGEHTRPDRFIQRG